MVTLMRRRNPILSGAVAAALSALALPVAAAGGGSELVFRPLESCAPDPCVIEVNGESRADARLFATKEWGLYIVELPSESKEVLLDARSGKAILLMPSEVQRRTNKKDEETLHLDPRTSLGEGSYTLDKDGGKVAFKTDISEVHVTLPPREAKKADAAATPAPAVTGTATSAPAPPAPETAPAAPPSDEARACVRLETRPTPGIPGCSKSVYLKNTCDTPVAVTLHRTEHLMTGTVPETFGAAAPPATEEWIGCAWWSGATAPAQHDIVSAAFLERPHGHRH
jgi:hypothetical protein